MPTKTINNIQKITKKSTGCLYPYGMVMPGRNTTGSPDYPSGYQGAYTRKDNDNQGTEWDAFELRMYDSRMARWMSRDPYRQYNSPYMAMGNNPVSTVDPDGGFSVTAAQAIVGGVGVVAGGAAAYNAAGGTSGGWESIGWGLAGAAGGAAAGYGLASIDYGAVLNGIGNGAQGVGNLLANNKDYALRALNALNNGASNADNALASLNNDIGSPTPQTKWFKVKGNEDNGFGPGLIHEQKVTGVDDKTTIDFDNLGHKDRIRIFDENDKKLWDVRGGEYFSGPHELKLARVYKNNPKWKGTKITIRVRGGRTSPTAFNYTVWGGEKAGRGEVLRDPTTRDGREFIRYTD